MAVSPGDASELVLIGDACPTFSWGEVEGAEAYELAVYRLGELGSEEEPALRQELPGSAESWTPSLDRCLRRSGRYAWSVRAVGESLVSEGSGDWSAPSFFQVAAGPSEVEFEEALAVVRSYLSAHADTSQPVSDSPSETGPGSHTIDTDTTCLDAGVVCNFAASVSEGGAATSGDSATGFFSEGKIEPPRIADEMTRDEELLPGGGRVVLRLLQCASNKGWRYWDLDDGTVLDCNTGLIWLKDASCADLPGTDSDGKANWEGAQSAAAALASGTCGLTDGSVAGDWRVPTILEFCSAWSGSSLFPCPSSSASDSLIDSSVPGYPKVVTAQGDRRWREGDVFVGVVSDDYWSVTDSDSGLAWGADLVTGSVFRNGKINLDLVWPIRSARRLAP